MNAAKPGTAEGNPLPGLWIGALAPPAAWVLHLSLLPWSIALLCQPGGAAALYGFALVALLVDVAGGVLAWHGYRPARHASPNANTETKRRRYFGLVGMIGSVIFGIAIVAQTWLLGAYAAC